jgi:DNA repair protein REV1
MKSSQSTDYFGDDQEDFKDALMLLDAAATRSSLEAPAVNPHIMPVKELPQKRKHDEVEQSIKGEDDVNPHILATMRQRDDKDDIYGASSFGDYGEYMSRKRAKLQIQNANMVDLKSTIFEGIEIYVCFPFSLLHPPKALQINGRVEPSLQELREMIVEHGGIFHAYLTKKSLVFVYFATSFCGPPDSSISTHVLAMNLTPAKVKELAHMKVVRPAWIVESIKAGYLLPWKEFKLVIDDRADAAQGKRGGQTLLRAIQPPRTPLQQTVTRKDDPAISTSPIKDPIYMTDPITMEQAARIPSYALNKSNTAAQRLMARPGWREENTAVSGTKFIDKYYENSRLHHLSMWKAELKDLVSKARERHEGGEVPSLEGSDAPATVKPMGHGVSMKGAELLKIWETPSPSKKGKELGEPIVQHVYMHCDFDSFFVAAGLLAHPEMRGRPIVVCHSQGSGEGAASTSEIASSSYEARAAGIHNGMRYGFTGPIMNLLT